MPERPDSCAGAAGLLAELLAYEYLLQTAGPADAWDRAQRLLATDFREVGASGRCYDRAATLNALTGRIHPPSCGVPEDAHGAALGPDFFLVTYRLPDAARPSRRVNLWARKDGVWQLLYHQGTAVAPDRR